MNDSPPSNHEWQALYEAANQFYSLRPWEWMMDSEMFGVLNPETGETGYCCVMGNLGELYALGVYLGTDGLESYLMIQEGALTAEDPDLLHYQRCLMASFEDRDALDKPDLKTIKDLKLKFRGRNSWPVFRSYRPGYFPWYLTAEEARFLTIALQQTLDIAQRLKDDSELLEPPEEELYLVRVAEITDGKQMWKDRWLLPAPIENKSAPVTVEAVDESRLQGIKDASAAYPGTWEVDFFYAPTPIAEEGRPYFPYLLICVDRDSHFILGFHLAQPGEHLAEFQNKFLEVLEESRSLPKRISVEKEDLFDLLLPATTRLGIRMTLVESLETIDDVRDSLFAFSMGESFEEDLN